jgi:potassium-transporting ATPase KdpC subunit
MSTLTAAARQHTAALRILLVFTVVLGIAYPLAVFIIGRIPGLQSRADGSAISLNGRQVGSSLIGQSFTDSDGAVLKQYFQPRPSHAGDGYDPTATSASNLGPESVLDTLPDPSVKGDTGTQSLLTQVCAASLAIGTLDGVDGSRPFCTPDGVGAVLAVFWSGPGYAGHVTRVVSVNQTRGATPFLPEYHGVKVELDSFGLDLSRAQIVPVRGDAPAHPAVPADAVTGSGSGLDPDISPAYAAIQENVVARARGISVTQVRALVGRYTTGRALGFMGERVVDVVELNAALDRQYPSARG